MVGKVGTTLMTKEERWKAAIEEAKPLLAEARRIRDKYDLKVLKIFVSHYNDRNRWGDLSTSDDPHDKDREGLYELSYCGDDDKENHYLSIKWSDFDDDNDAPDDTKEEVE